MRTSPKRTTAAASAKKTRGPGRQPAAAARSRGGTTNTKGWKESAAAHSPVDSASKAREIPHRGHGSPERRRNGQNSNPCVSVPVRAAKTRASSVPRKKADRPETAGPMSHRLEEVGDNLGEFSVFNGVRFQSRNKSTRAATRCSGTGIRRYRDKRP